MLIYAEGGRSRSGGLGEPRPGIGRLALESGVPVVPMAIHGSAGVRGWKRLRFPKVTVQFGEPLGFPAEAKPTRERQQEVANEIFDRVRTHVRDARGAGPPQRDQVAAQGPAGSRAGQGLSRRALARN